MAMTFCVPFISIPSLCYFNTYNWIVSLVCRNSFGLILADELPKIKHITLTLFVAHDDAAAVSIFETGD
jgi:hypothetical protein